MWLVSLEEEKIWICKETGGAHAQRNNHVWTQEKAGICQPRREASEERKPTNFLILDFLPPELWQIKFKMSKPLNLCIFFFFYDVPIRLKVCFYQKLCFLPLLLFGFSLSHRKTQFEESITKSFTLKYTWQRDLEMSPFSGLSCHLNLTSLLWVPGLKI